MLSISNRHADKRHACGHGLRRRGLLTPPIVLQSINAKYRMCIINYKDNFKLNSLEIRTMPRCYCQDCSKMFKTHNRGKLFEVSWTTVGSQECSRSSIHVFLLENISCPSSKTFKLCTQSVGSYTSTFCKLKPTMMHGETKLKTACAWQCFSYFVISKKHEPA